MTLICLHLVNDIMATAASELFCVESTCKHDRKDTRDKRHHPMLQCFLCYRWFHNECVGVSKTAGELVSLWPCLDCRTLTMQVKQLQGCINALTSVVNEMKFCLSKSAEDISELGSKCDLLTADNSDLKENVASLTLELKRRDKLDDSDIMVGDDESEDEADELGTLLIGDSIVRSICSTNNDFQIRSIGGAKVNDIKRAIKEINPKKEKYKDMFILCGTNDISTKKNAEKIACEFESLLKYAKCRADKVHLASITPRSDDNAHDIKIAKVNELLLGMAADAAVGFIDNDKNFRYRDGSVDESLISPIDKVHLSSSGSKKLLDNFKLHDLAKVRSGLGNSTQLHKQEKMNAFPLPTMQSSFTPHTSYESNDSLNKASTPLKFRGPHNSLSNFYGSQIRMWGLTFSSNEHAYQYRKAMEMGEYAIAERIRQAPHPRAAQLIAKDIRTDDRWKGLKQSIMYELLQEKSRQCSTFRRDLIASADAVLVEDTAHDFWGRGPMGNGLNALGRLLMTLRQNLPPPNKSPNSQMSPLSKHGVHRNPPSLTEQQVRCYNCGEKSHTKKSCKHAAQLRCHRCSELGHKRKACPQVSDV